MSEPKSFGSKQFTVARSAVDFLVRSVTGQHGIQRSMAFGTVEALLVPHSTFGELLFGGEYHATTAGASLTSWCLDSRRIRIVKWARG